MSARAAQGRGGDASARARDAPTTHPERGQGRHAPLERPRRAVCAKPVQPCLGQSTLRSAWHNARMAARNELRLQRCSPSELFRAVFCACGDEKAPLVLDVRPKAAFARGHVAGAYCVRTSANGAALLDYSGGGQARPWAPGAWHDVPLLLLTQAGGDDDDPPLDKRHPVAAFLIAEGAARSLAVVKGGCEARGRACMSCRF